MMEETQTVPRILAPRDSIGTVTGTTFTPLVLDTRGPVVVEFMSYGCSHCRALEPALQEVAKMVKSKGKIFRANIAVERGLASSYGVQVTPTLVMFLNGKEVGRAEGPPPTVPSVLTAVTQPFRVVK